MTIQELLCWHRFVVKQKFDLCRAFDNRVVGSRFVLMCTKCGCLKTKDTA